MSGRSDPRIYQIAVLGSLLVYGALALDFEVSPARVATSVGTALLAQAVCGRLFGHPRFDGRSAAISGLSLALLLRTPGLPLLAVAAALAVASKFVLRLRGKHVFNPSCFAIVALLATTDNAWVSAGQWGNPALFGLAVAGAGGLVLYRAARWDVTLGFLACFAALVLGRAAWLGDPLAVPLHGLRSGALLIFAFFMISDPKTVPDTRAGRLVFAAAVALGAAWVEFGLHARNGLLWSLAACAPLVPLIDRCLPGRPYVWRDAGRRPGTQEKPMQIPIRRPLAPLLALGLVLAAGEALAFCGFYVAKADAKLYNRASQVVLVRDGDRTVVTMANDFQGDPKEFAVVVPVPTFLERRQIHVGDRAVIDHLDAYTAPRLVEYHDPDPCAVARASKRFAFDAALPEAAVAERESVGRAEGVRVEARYAVGEYDILILSADESRGLARWLRRNGYRLPTGAEPVLRSYVRQGMRFFVAKVNLERHQRGGFAFLRPLQIAYESPKFMLPIRLGTLNANGPQDLLVYTLTRTGRVETVNYRTVKLPSDAEIPSYVKAEFGEFYRALFGEQVRRHAMSTVFTEYAWDMNWCDPCAADPLSDEELRGLGVFWVDGPRGRGGKSAARDVFVTRLHVRYDAQTFPADLVFQETGDRSNFQGRYVMRHAFEGATCKAAEAYYEQVREREEAQARRLAQLTGWSLADIRRRMDLDRPRAEAADTRPWWERIWE